MMQWYHYAFLTAFTLGVADALVKKAAEKNDEDTLTLVRLAYALPFIIPALFLSKYHRWIPLFFRDCYCHSHRCYRSYSLPEGNQDISFIINPSVSCLHTCFRSRDFIRSFKRNP